MVRRDLLVSERIIVVLNPNFPENAPTKRHTNRKIKLSSKSLFRLKSFTTLCTALLSSS